MARRKITSIAVMLMICAVLGTSSASAYSVYDQGNVSTTYVQYYEDIVDKLTPNQSYVMWRNGQNEYCLYYSETLKYNTIFSDNNNGTLVRLYTSGNYNSTYNFDSGVISGFELNPNSVMVYSNLGYYPSLNESSEVYLYALLVFSGVIGCCLLIRPIFKYVLRVR